MLWSVEIAGDDLLLMEIREESIALIVVTLSINIAKKYRNEKIQF